MRQVQVNAPSEGDTMRERSISAMSLLLRWVGLLSLLLLGACSTISGAPPRLTSVDVLTAEDPDYKRALDRFYRQTSDTGRQRVRNQFVETRIAIIDHEYLKFRQSLYEGRVSTDLAADLGLLSLNALGAAVSSASAKTTYAALSAALVGSKTSIDKNVYFDRTVVALLSQMETLRNNKKVDLFRGLTLSITNYPLSYAKAETDEYYLAGTIARAIQGVNATTAVAAAKSENSLREEIKKRLEAKGIAVTQDSSDDVSDVLDTCYRDEANRDAINKQLKIIGYPDSLSDFTTEDATLQQRAVVLKALRAQGLCN